MPDYLEEFQQALCESIKCIDWKYFQIKRHNSSPAWRERAYCYELYHQLRNHLKIDFPYTLHGEIDKRGHEEICSLFNPDPKRCPNPDFVIHVPGTQDNLAVIEVKSSDSLFKSKDDLEKLQFFIEKIDYKCGIFLVFGDEASENDINDLVECIRIKEGIHIIWHKNVAELTIIL